MSARYTGLHAGRRPASADLRTARLTRTPRQRPLVDAISRRHIKRAMFWAFMATCIAFSVSVFVGFIQLNYAIGHPEENGFDGWLCAAESGTCEP